MLELDRQEWARRRGQEGRKRALGAGNVVQHLPNPPGVLEAPI